MSSVNNLQTTKQNTRETKFIKIKNFLEKSEQKNKQSTYRNNSNDSITNSENSVMKIKRNSKEVQQISSPVSSPEKSEIK